MDSSNNLDFAQLDRLFHQSIYELSGNNTLIDLLGNLNDMIFVTATKALSRLRLGANLPFENMPQFWRRCAAERGPGSPGHETPHGADSL